MLRTLLISLVILIHSPGVQADDARCADVDKGRLMDYVDKMTKSKVRDEYRFQSHDQCISQVEKVVDVMIRGMSDMMASIAKDTGQPAEDPEPYCVIVRKDNLYIGVFVSDWKEHPIPDSIYRCSNALGQIW